MWSPAGLQSRECLAQGRTHLGCLALQLLSLLLDLLNLHLRLPQLGLHLCLLGLHLLLHAQLHLARHLGLSRHARLHKARTSPVASNHASDCPQVPVPHLHVQLLLLLEQQVLLQARARPHPSACTASRTTRSWSSRRGPAAG